jgi:hypothetical protein
MGLVLAMWLAAVAPMPVLSDTSPDEVPSGAVIAQWQMFQGEARTPKGDRIRYRLLVDPHRLALYRITRYRVHAAGDADAANEVLIWNSAPGVERVLRCYERVAHDEKGVMSWSWQPVPPATDRYLAAMQMATQVYFLQRQQEREEEERAARH